MQTVTTYPTERVLRLVLERAKVFVPNNASCSPPSHETISCRRKGNNPKTNERDTAAKDARAERRPNEEGSHFEIKHQVNVILT